MPRPGITSVASWPADRVALLDELVEQRRREAGTDKISRSDVLWDALRQYRDRRKKRESKR